MQSHCSILSSVTPISAQSNFCLIVIFIFNYLKSSFYVDIRCKFLLLQTLALSLTLSLYCSLSLSFYCSLSTVLSLSLSTVLSLLLSLSLAPTHVSINANTFNVSAFFSISLKMAYLCSLIFAFP